MWIQMNSRVKSIVLFMGGGIFGYAVSFFPVPHLAPDISPDERKQATTFSGGKSKVDDLLEHRDDFEIDDPSLSFRQLRRAAENRAIVDPAAAVEEAMKIRGHDNREAYFAEALGTWGEIDGKAAVEWCRERFEGELLSDGLYYVSEGWGESDPEAAAKWFHDNTETSTREDALWEVLESWGRKDPEKAFLWADELEPDIKSAVIDAVAEGWAAVDPARAGEIGAGMEGKPYQYEFLVSVASHWSDIDPEAAVDWATGVLHEGMRNGVLAEIGENWANRDAGEATRLAEGMEPGANRQSLIGGIVSGWSEHDPDGAMDWLLGIDTEENHRAELIGDVIYNWSEIDPRGTVDWLESQDEGPRKDNVLAVFSDVVMNIDSEAAVAWANQISDPAARESKLRSLLSLWVKRDGALALRTLQQMELPAELKSEFLEQ